MKYSTALAIVGPTGSGKTKVAFELARRMGGEVINIDKMYLFKHFPISTGLADTLAEKGVVRHLYEILEPDEEIISPDTYTTMIQNTAREILSRGALPIIEGCSTTYIPNFLESNGGAKFCTPIIGLRLGPSVDPKERTAKRVDIALQDGLLNEVQRGLEKYRNTLVMTTSHFIVPLVHHLDGLISMERAREEIINRCLDYADRQMKMLMQYREIMWIEHDPKDPYQTVEKIVHYL